LLGFQYPETTPPSIPTTPRTAPSRQGAKWYRRAAEQGDGDAQMFLAFMYLSGDDLPKDPSEAEKWFEQLDAHRQFFVSMMLEDGASDVRKDLKAAAKWRRRAAQRGDVIAQVELGLRYAEGKGVPQDFREAANWNRRAAQQGDPTGQANLGKLYAEGKGVPPDSVVAYMWLNLATTGYSVAEEGNLGRIMAENRADTARLRDIVAEHMTPAQIAEAQRLTREWKVRAE
jgi:TPR repeat protein